MECSVCGEIIHPSCSEKKAPCKISKKVNNSWECPKCCQSDDEVRVVRFQIFASYVPKLDRLRFQNGVNLLLFYVSLGY